MKQQTIFFLLFLLFLGTFTVFYLQNFYVMKERIGYYVAWDFYECYAETLNAEDCTNSVIKAPGGYFYYPPIVFLIAQIIPLQLLFPLTLLALFLILAIGTNNFLTPLVFALTSHNLFATYIRAGTVPFFFFLLGLTITIFYWHKLPVWLKYAFITLMIFTHRFGGGFFLLAVIVFEFLEEKYAMPALLMLSFSVAFYTVFFMGYDWRGFFLPLLFASVWFGKSFSPGVQKNEVV